MAPCTLFEVGRHAVSSSPPSNLSCQIAFCQPSSSLYQPRVVRSAETPLISHMDETTAICLYQEAQWAQATGTGHVTLFLVILLHLHQMTAGLRGRPISRWLSVDVADVTPLDCEDNFGAIMRSWLSKLPRALVPCLNQ
jgi:hypothetical protein